MSQTDYLVSGANRGIGLGIVAELASRDNTIVFAGARNPGAATDLQALVEKNPGKVHIVKLISADRAGNDAAVEEIKTTAGRLDVVIANAGLANHYGPTLEVPIETMREHFEVNVIGTLVLFQATYPLLKASTPTPKFIPISSGAGSIALAPSLPTPVVAYGVTKAAGNFLARKLHFENEGLVCFPMSPGVVDTDMAKYAREKNLLPKDLPVSTPEACAKSMLKIIDDSAREKDGGKFVNVDGSILNW